MFAMLDMTKEKQSLIHVEVQAQKEAVTSAQFKFFETALKTDQALISKVQNVPATLKAKMHMKLVEQRQSQADAAQKAATGYQERGHGQSSFILARTQGS